MRRKESAAVCRHSSYYAMVKTIRKTSQRFENSHYLEREPLLTCTHENTLNAQRMTRVSFSRRNYDLLICVCARFVNISINPSLTLTLERINHYHYCTYEVLYNGFCLFVWSSHYSVASAEPVFLTCY